MASPSSWPTLALNPPRSAERALHRSRSKTFLASPTPGRCCGWGRSCAFLRSSCLIPGLGRGSPLCGDVHVYYTSRDPKQLRADGQAQTCQQLVAFCASTRMNQNDAVVNLARVALLHVCCWRASRFSTAPELRLGKRARWRASART